ncbi:MAG: hypothetical protein WBA28_02360 [Microbacteriaceae bacterium]
MKRADIITVIAIAVVVISLAILHATGQGVWTEIIWIVLFALVAILFIIRLFRNKNMSAIKSAAQTVDPMNDMLLGVNYSGPRILSPHTQQGIELVDESQSATQDFTLPPEKLND